MTLLIIGLVLFFAVHLVPDLALKSALVKTFGRQGYRGLFSLVALAGLGLIIYGKGHSAYELIWAPPLAMRYVTAVLMLIAIVLLTISVLPNNLRRGIRHPMLLGVCLWAVGHLLANGNLSTLLLCGSFLAFSVWKMLAVSKRGPFLPPAPVGSGWNFITIVAGVGFYVLIVLFHGKIAGIPLA